MEKSHEISALSKRSSLIPASDLHIVESSAGGYHSFGEDEKQRFSELINLSFEKDKDLKHLLPLNPLSNDLFSQVSSGLLLCKMVNDAEAGTIDERALNKKPVLNIFQQKENLNLAISSAKSIGCRLVNINPQLILDKREHIILGLIWQLVRAKYLARVNLKENPYLLTLKEVDEELTDLMKLPPEQLLLRWLNYHLKNANYNQKVTNFSSDLQSAHAYIYLLSQLDQSKQFDKSILNQNSSKLAIKVINDAKKLGVQSTMASEDITTGNSKLNLLFCAQLFNTCPCLKPPAEAIRKEASILLKTDDEEDNREERSFRMWINSLGIEQIYINNLFEDLKDGLALLHVIDKVEEGIVDWKKAALHPENKFKKLQNTNYVVELGKKMNFSLVGIGGVDITDGNKKLVLAYVWQLMKKHLLKCIAGASDDQLLKWALERVKEDPKINSFKDKSIKNCKFLFNFLNSFDDKLIDWSLVSNEESEEAYKSNAQYLLAEARKLGATIFLVWEDIIEVKPKMILSFVASVGELFKPKSLKKSKTTME